MVLVSVQPENNCLPSWRAGGLTSWWRPTHHMTWENVCRAAHSAYSEVFDYTAIDDNKKPIKKCSKEPIDISNIDDFEMDTRRSRSNAAIYVDEEPIKVSNADEILMFAEHSTITINGLIRCDDLSMTMTFCNHLQLVEFKITPHPGSKVMEPDYQKFNILFGSYMDLIESAMH